MLKQRLVGVVVVRGGIAVQSLGFSRYLPIGAPRIAVDYLNRWGIDEIVLLDTDATAAGRGPDLGSIADCTRYCHVPLAVGGGIRDTEQMRAVVHAGADKLVLNTAAADDPALVTEGARLFGSQCIVVSIDARQVRAGGYEAFVEGGSRAAGLTPEALAGRAERDGAGEIFLNSIDRDGAKTGYDIDLIQRVTRAVSIPVVVCGGVSHPSHLLSGLSLGVSGVAAANFFNYTEHSVIATKRYLVSRGGNVRLDSYASYENRELDRLGRIRKLPDPVLEKLRFDYIPEDVI